MIQTYQLYTPLASPNPLGATVHLILAANLGLSLRPKFFDRGQILSMLKKTRLVQSSIAIQAPTLVPKLLSTSLFLHNSFNHVAQQPK